MTHIDGARPEYVAPCSGLLHFHFVWGVGVLLLALIVGPALQGAVTYTSGHTDLAIGYDATTKTLIPHWHLDAGNSVDGAPLLRETVYAPEDLVAEFSRTREAPTGSSSYLGVAPGTPIYMGGSSALWQPYLGFGSHAAAPAGNLYDWSFSYLEPEDWSVGPYSGAIGVSLTGWTAPAGGQFALYKTNVAGTATSDIFMSTYDPAIANLDGLGPNAWYLEAGGHEHYTFGFTTPGAYSLTLEFWGLHTTDGPISATGTFHFIVVPEPAVGGLVMLGSIGVLLTRRRRHHHR